MRKDRTILLFLALFWQLHPSFSQYIERVNSKRYSVNEGLLQSTLIDMEFDRNNFCWLSFPNGLQVFDGNTFTVVPVQPGLPEDKQVYFLRTSDGELLLSHSRGISHYNINADNFRLVIKANEARGAQFIGEDDGIIYIYTDSGHIKGLDKKTFAVVSDVRTGIPASTSSNIDARPKISDNIIDHRVAMNVMSTLYLWDLKTGRMIAASQPIPSISIFNLMMLSSDEVMYFTYKVPNAMHRYNFSTHTTTVDPITGKDDLRISRSILLPWDDRTIISFNNRLYVLDTIRRSLQAELVNFQNEPVAGSASIARIKQDNFGNLCLATITAGIVKIIRNNYDFKYYGTASKRGNMVLSVLPDKANNRVLVGAVNEGVLVFDTMQRLIRQVQAGPKNPEFSPNAMLKASNGDYIIFATGERRIWRLNKDLSRITPIPIDSDLPPERSGIDYFANIIYEDGHRAIVQSQGMLYKVDMDANTVKESFFTTFYTMSGVLYRGNVVSHTNNELIFLDTSNFRRVRTIPFGNTGGVRCFARDASDHLYIGSNKGIFKTDSTGRVLMVLDKSTGLPDECIYAMAFDSEGLLWCSSNKGIFRINPDRSIFQVTRDDGLQENEFNTNVVGGEGGELYFGGVNGVSSFYPHRVDKTEERINLLFRRIRINNDDAFTDTAVWSISKIDLPHNRNLLSFDFIAMASNNPGQYTYQYMMEGIDDEWIQNNGLQTVRYFLPPGKYVLKIYASRYFNKEAKPLHEVSITIRPPFWKTWWFLSLLGLLLLFAMGYAIDQYNKAKYRKKLAELESEHRIQVERERISRDLHDNIGAYAHAVLYNTELLEKEDEAAYRDQLMKDLKFASKDIIMALRETIWALKKESYSADECLMRIRNFIQPFTRYYHQITFRIDGDAPKLRLHYTRALNLVRIVQEAVTNALKHADAKNISVSSRVVDGGWELEVADDGKGMHEKTKKEEGNGMNNMKIRSADSGFNLRVISNDAGGTSIKVLVRDDQIMAAKK